MRLRFVSIPHYHLSVTRSILSLSFPIDVKDLEDFTIVAIVAMLFDSLLGIVINVLVWFALATDQFLHQVPFFLPTILVEHVLTILLGLCGVSFVNVPLDVVFSHLPKLFQEPDDTHLVHLLRVYESLVITPVSVLHSNTHPFFFCHHLHFWSRPNNNSVAVESVKRKENFLLIFDNHRQVIFNISTDLFTDQLSRLSKIDVLYCISSSSSSSHINISFHVTVYTRYIEWSVRP